MKFLKAIVQRGPIGWFRRLFHIVRMYHADLMAVANHVDDQRAGLERAMSYIKKATKLHVNIPASQKNATTVILIGQYRGKDHVQTFNLHPKDINHLMDILRQMSSYAVVERIDSPYEINATVKRELQI